MRRLVACLSVISAAALSAAACGEGSRHPAAETTGGAGQSGESAAGREHSGAAPPQAGAEHEASGGSGIGGSPSEPEPHAGASGAGGAGGADTAGSNDVVGSVRAGYAPFPGVVVRLNGTEVTSGTDGGFTIRDAPDEYELTVYVPEFKLVRVYDGLRTRHPTVNLGYAELDREQRTATVQGKIIGGAPPPLPHECWTEASYVSNTRGHMHTYGFSPPAAFELSLRWTDAGESDTGEILVLQGFGGIVAPVTSFTGYGRRTVTISEGTLLGSLSGSPLTNVTLVDPEEYALSGALEAPDGLTLGGAALLIGGWRSNAWLESGSYSLTLPSVAEPKAIRVEMYGDIGSVRSSWVLPDAATTGFDLVVPALPALVAPEEGNAAIASDSEFRWSNLPENSVALLWMKVGDYTLERVTAGTSAALPDLSSLGLSLPAAARGSWNVQAVGPAATTDDALVVQRAGTLEAPTRWYFVEPAAREFALAP